MSDAFLKKSTGSAIAGAATLLAGFISTVVVANLLGVEGAGLVAFAVWLSVVLAPVIDGGTSLSVLRFFADRTGRKDHQGAQALAGFLLRRLLGFAIVAAIAAVAIAVIAPGAARDAVRTLFPAVDIATATGLVALVVALTLAQALATFTISYHRGAQAFGFLAKIAAVAFALQVAAVTIGTLFYGATGAVAGYVLGQTTLALFALPLVLHRAPLEPLLRREIWQYGRYAWAANMCNIFVWSRMEILFLQLYWGAAEVGLFSVAVALAALASQGPLLLTGAFLPVLAAHNSRGDKEAVQKVFSNGTTIVALLALPACFGMAAIAQPMIVLLYGPDFAAAGTATAIILVAAAISVSSTIGTHLVNALGRSDFIFWSSIAGAVVAVALGFLLIPEFGLVGAALTRASVQIAAVMLGIWFITRRLRYAYPFARLIRLTLAAAAPAGAAFAVTQLVAGPLGLLEAILAGLVVYPLSLRLFGALGPDERAAIIHFAERFPPFSRPAANAFVSFLAPAHQS